ncbi:FAD-dependent oxidoreductase [Novosphingobium sp. KACC 22771]|uniref:FAD-dependent oxidoreductase n=1 Tax=Novosphingobium sp. KACC 22771 TaxID=3025670 RepID=UPI0023669DB7|nr:FAD-dependent oxidoreductase [Novosphingobium sp. KACC 22771]WDF74574.1 FAD-dependent oxidoreductase [Novosphingobium sp. KACC 22771]
MIDPALFDIAIIGGGPAGQAAAQQTLAAGLSTTMIDEQARPGGQILRQPPPAFAVKGWMAGRLYRPLRRLLAQTEADARLKWRGATSVAGIERIGDHFRLTLSGTHGGTLLARRVLIAAGCYDMPVAMPGWTLPGVMSAGAVQTMLKSQQVVAGQPIVLLGSHPLLLVLATQILDAGGEVAAVLMPQTYGRMVLAALPYLAGAMFTPGPLMAAGAAMARLRRAGVPLMMGARPVGFTGDGRLEAVDYAWCGRTHRIAAQAAAVSYGFLPQSDLPRQVGAAVRWARPAGGWETICDGAMRSSIPGLYVAGETTGVAGADAAMAEGTIAGIAMAMDAGARAPFDMARAQARRARLQPFINLLRAVADPGDVWPLATPETLLCRCEDISVAQVAATIDRLPAMADASAVKHRCRIGMGLCQGRSCEHALVRRIAAARGCDPDAVAPFRTRFPARPLPFDEIIG